MGRKAEGIRPWYDRTIDKWHVRDGSKKISLGFGGDNNEGATRAYDEVRKYKAEKEAGGKLEIRRQSTAEITVADVIAFYVDRRIKNFVPSSDYPTPVARPEDSVRRLAAVLDFFQDTPLEGISRIKCEDFGVFVHHREIERKQEHHNFLRRRYEEKLEAYAKITDAREKRIHAMIASRRTRVLPTLRSKPPEPLEPFNPATIEYRPSASRRYLEELSATITFAIKYELIRHKVHIFLPPKYEARSAIFSFEEIKRLIRAAYYHKGMGWVNGGPVKGLFTRRHLARFILLAVSTGSRKDKVERVGFKDEGDRPWVELWQEPVMRTHRITGEERQVLVWRGRYHRLGDDEVKYKTKKAPSFPITEIAANRLARWRAQGIDYPCAYPYHRTGKQEPGDVKDGMRTLFDEVLGVDNDAVIHIFRHTAATWMCSQADLPLPSIAGYLGMSTETLVKTYAKHREQDLLRIADALSDPTRAIHKRQLRGTNGKPTVNVRQKPTVIDRMEINGSKQESTGIDENPLVVPERLTYRR
ncbi:site-specific integrase [Neorhizobium galegae]|uniref:Putative phage integrase n=1 Tax=Neorhizobium galegae bv. orientalis str. HAMBI 540 TaxID=1028800 RepID=A0A068SM45_NEOGA|nr:hypothetical protein [Neorhizobium galegae]CDN46869.1 Putative phage integrase [Neorhizobium galegae bv. orientalis str. HAMBI 540]